MKINRNFANLALALGALVITAGSCSAQAQRLADPAYFYPGPNWTQLESGAPTAGIAIMNPNSGSGTAQNSDYVAQVKQAQAKGLKVVGYVDTAYGKRSTSLVKADILNYYNWYHVDGIFFDEASNLQPQIPYYKAIYQLVKNITTKSTVIINPGCATLEGYINTADIIVSFESPYDEYQSGFVQSPWVTKYPASRFMHIVLGVTQEELQSVIEETKQRHAGWVYITTYSTPANPYDNLPTNPYWTDELKELAGSK